MAAGLFVSEERAGLSARNSVVFLQRAEGLAVAAVTATLYARTGASWWIFAALWLAPDLSMLGYLTGPCRGARIYNGFHNYVLPAVLGMMGLVMHAQMAIAISLIWGNHIGVDRMLGYGLKFRDGFQWTHLGRIGRKSS